MENKDEDCYSVLMKVSLPSDITFNVIENRLSMAIGDNYYFALVVGELDEFPVSYSTHFSYKFDHTKADKLFEKLMLKQAYRKDSDITDSIVKYETWKRDTGQPEFDANELKRKMTDGPWRYTQPFTCYRYENHVRVNYLNFIS